MHKNTSYSNNRNCVYLELAKLFYVHEVRMLRETSWNFNNVVIKHDSLKFVTTQFIRNTWWPETLNFEPELRKSEAAKDIPLQVETRPIIPRATRNQNLHFSVILGSHNFGLTSNYRISIIPLSLKCKSTSPW